MNIEQAEREVNCFYVFKRGDKFLNPRYQWSDLPEFFEGWRKTDLEYIFGKMPDAPEYYAVIEGNTLNLDEVEWRKI